MIHPYYRLYVKQDGKNILLSFFFQIPHKMTFSLCCPEVLAVDDSVSYCLLLERENGLCEPVCDCILEGKYFYSKQGTECVVDFLRMCKCKLLFCMCFDKDIYVLQETQQPLPDDSMTAESIKIMYSSGAIVFKTLGCGVFVLDRVKLCAEKCIADSETLNLLYKRHNLECCTIKAYEEFKELKRQLTETTTQLQTTLHRSKRPRT